MTDKELRKLSRLDLITIIYELQLQNEAMKKELSDRRLMMEEAGSIAEASLKVNDVFETVQTAADQYLTSIKATSEQIEEKLKSTDDWCRQMISITEEDCAARCAEADQEIEKKLADFKKKIKAILTSNPELAATLKKNKAQKKAQEQKKEADNVLNTEPPQSKIEKVRTVSKNG